MTRIYQDIPHAFGDFSQLEKTKVFNDDMVEGMRSLPAEAETVETGHTPHQDGYFKSYQSMAGTTLIAYTDLIFDHVAITLKCTGYKNNRRRRPNKRHPQDIVTKRTWAGCW